MDIRNFFGGKGSAPKSNAQVDLTGPSEDDARAQCDDRIQISSEPEIVIEIDDAAMDKPGGDVNSGAQVPQTTISPGKGGVRKETPKGVKASTKRQASTGSPVAKAGSATPASKKAKMSPTPKKSASKSGGKRSAKAPAATAMMSDRAEEAIALVQEVIKEFTTQEAQEAYAEDLVFQDAEMRGAAPDEPKNRGKGPVPVGHPDCLTGLTFVVSGVLDSMERPVFEDFVRRHGGRITSSVSGKTDFLVVGDKVGRTKVEKAVEKGVNLITEEGVWRLVAATSSFIPNEADKVDEVEKVEGVDNGGGRMGEAGVGTAAVKGQQTDTSKGSAPAFRAAKNQELWVDKYKPKTSADLVGNNQMVSNLKSWLSTWDAVHLFHSSAGGEMKKRGKALENKKAVYVLIVLIVLIDRCTNFGCALGWCFFGPAPPRVFSFGVIHAVG